MDTIGAILKEARLKQKKSIDDIVETTKITKASITAIESDSFEFCPGHAYTRAFIKIYAEELMLDAEELAVMYDRKMSGENGIDSKMKPISKMGSNFLPGDKKIISVVIICLIASLLFFFGYGKDVAVKIKKETPAKAEKKPVNKIIITKDEKIKKELAVKSESLRASKFLKVEKEDPADEKLKSEVKIKEPGKEVLIETREESPADGSPDALDEPDKFVVRFVARDLTWVKIVADDEPSEVMLRAGDSYSKSAVTSMRVRIGNSGGISLFYNDIPIGSPGKIGEPVNLLFPEAAENLKKFE